MTLGSRFVFPRLICKWGKSFQGGASPTPTFTWIWRMEKFQLSVRRLWDLWLLQYKLRGYELSCRFLTMRVQHSMMDHVTELIHHLFLLHLFLQRQDQVLQTCASPGKPIHRQ